MVGRVTIILLVAIAMYLSPLFLLFVGAMRTRRTRIFLFSALAAGCMAGVLLAWSLLPASWPLSFGETLEASINAAKYGHPVEHYAEGAVILMWCASAAGAFVCGGAATLACRASRFRRC